MKARAVASIRRSLAMVRVHGATYSAILPTPPPGATLRCPSGWIIGVKGNASKSDRLFAAPQGVDVVVGLARRLRDAVAAATGQCQLRGVVQVILWPAETNTGLTLVLVRTTRPMTAPRSVSGDHDPASRPGSSILADVERFGAAEARHVEPEADVRGQAEAARVGDPLAVEHDRVGGRLDLGEGRQQRRRLAERQQTGDVGEVAFDRRPAPLHDRQVRQAQHDDAGEDGRASICCRRRRRRR